MSITGLCQICEQNTAEYQCSRCGTLVCEKHFVEDQGLCSDCAGR
jgi:DNA-directed RNA polymerase subunit RPC12/RpoP